MKNKFILSKMLKYTIKINRSFIPLVLTKSIVVSLLTLLSSFIVSITLKVVSGGVNVLAESMNKIITILFIILLLSIISNLLNNLFESEKERTANLFNGFISDKLTRVKYANLEDPNFIEVKEQAKYALDNQSSIYRLIFDISNLFQASITLISLISLVVLLEPILLLIVFVAFIFHLIILLLSNKTQVSLFKQIIPINRKFGYYMDLMFDPASAKDFRLYDVGRSTYANYCRYSDEFSNEMTRTRHKLAHYSTLDGANSVISTGITYLIVTYKTIAESLSIANFSFQIAACTSLMNELDNFTSSYIDIREVKEYCNNIISLLEEKEEENFGSVKLEEINKIEFKNVSFTYPKTTNEILHNISFVINKKEKISIVGLNGAGKTTIIKLLCRLYDNYSGEILINDINIKDYDIISYRENITTVFQDYKLFKFSIKENVSLLEDNDTKLEKVLEQIDVKKVVDKLPMSYNTPLGKDYDEQAVELSGGEMQKIAIARSLYKDSSLTILDEPTSALDPKSEAAIYENFNNIVKDKTTIYVSHRMSSSIFCDKILVIENGYVKDYLPHSELMKKPDSLYYKLFMMQANNYKE